MDIVWALGIDLSGVLCFVCVTPASCVYMCLWTRQDMGLAVREQLWKVGFLPLWDARIKLKSSGLHNKGFLQDGAYYVPDWPGTGYSVSGTGIKGVLP